jgi:hypothetical protein
MQPRVREAATIPIRSFKRIAAMPSYGGRAVSRRERSSAAGVV